MLNYLNFSFIDFKQVSVKKIIYFKNLFRKIEKNGDFIFTLLNKAIFTSHRVAFCFVSQYCTV